jgi:SpoVK/Ycf46/Vps4 family AAA+-type ATPase
VTKNFTGADLTEICQRAVKFAIRESIEKAYERAKAREAAAAGAPGGGDAAMAGADAATGADEEYDVSSGAALCCCFRGSETIGLLHTAMIATLRSRAGSCHPPLPPLTTRLARPQPVPEVTARHFEMAMRDARRSVSDADLVKYTSFATSLSQQRAAIGGPGGLANFRFPRAPAQQQGGGGGGGGAGAGGAPAAAAAADDEEDLYA